MTEPPDDDPDDYLPHPHFSQDQTLLLLQKQENVSWIAHLLEDYKLEEPQIEPHHASSDDVNSVTESAVDDAISADIDCLKTRYVSLPSKRFLRDVFPRLKPSCCLKRKTALSVRPAVKSRLRGPRHIPIPHSVTNLNGPRRRTSGRQEVLERRGVELFEVIGLGEPAVEPHDCKHSRRLEKHHVVPSPDDDQVWISKTSLRFKPCRPYEDSRQFFYMLNQTTRPIEFTWTIVGDPSVHSISNPPKIPTHTELLQEKPFFTQANMKFDPIVYSVGPVVGSEKLSIVDSWFQSYRRYRAKDNYSGTSAIPIASSEFLAAAVPHYMETSDSGNYQDAIARLFTVEPWSGTLPPLGSLSICVRYHPWCLTTAHAQMICTSSEGVPVPRNVYLMAPCARVNVEVKPRTLDLGSCLYDTLLERTLTITNRGRYTTEFVLERVEKLTKEKLTRPDFDVIYTNLLDGKVRPKEVVRINVYFVPGKPGKFVKFIYLCVKGEATVKVDILGQAVFHCVELDLPQRVPQLVKKCQTKRNKTESRFSNFSEKCGNVLDENGDIKPSEDVCNAVVSHWAKRSRHKAKTSNIQRNPVFNSNLEYRPFEGILDFARLPEYILDFGLHGPGSPKISCSVHVLNSGSQPVTFRLTQTNDPLRDKIAVTFNRHNLVRPEGVEPVTFTINPQNYVLGVSECPVLFTIINGPTFSVNCKMTIEEPRLTVRLCCHAKADRTVDKPPLEVFGCKVLNLAAGDGPPSTAPLKVPTIDFGTVRCGFMSTISVQLVNPGRITCVWTASELDIDYIKQSKQLGPKERNELKAFRQKHRSLQLSPRSSTLQPGQRVNLEMTFHPTDELDYNFAWRITMAHSQRLILLQAKGHGVQPRLELSASRIMFDSVLPFVAGQEKTLTIYNPCPFPVEFFCKELDKQHVYEDEIISHVEEFDCEKQVRFPVRKIGGTIPDTVVEFYKNHYAISPPPVNPSSSQFEHERVLSPQMGPRPDTPSSDPGTPVDVSNVKSNLLDEDELPPHLRERFPMGTLQSQYKKRFATKREMYRALRDVMQTPLRRAITASRGMNMSVDTRKEQFKKGVVFLIHGPPSCGKSTLARAFGKHYRLPVLTIDKIIMEAIQTPTDRIHHRVLNYIQNPVPPAQQPSYGPGAARSLQTPPDQDGKIREKPKVPTMKQVAKPVKPSSHSRGQGAGGIPNDPNAPRDRDPELAFQSKPFSYVNFLTDKQAELITCLVPEDMMSHLISARLYKQDCRRGVIFDGMRSDFVESFLSAARILLTALEDRKRIYSIVLCNTFRDYRKRRQRQRTRRRNDSYAKIIRHMAELRKLTETQYRNMRRTARKTVDATISEYITAMRLLKKRARLPPKLEVAPVPEVHGTSLQMTRIAKGASSTQKLVTIADNPDGLLNKKPSTRSDGHDSTDTISLPGALKSMARSTVSARVSVVKNKGKVPSNAQAGGKEGKVDKPKRDSWEILPKIKKDGSISGIYRTDIYRRHKHFYSTLKEYTTIMTKWTGSIKQEPRRVLRSETQKDQLPAATKKRTAKSKDAKSKPKEVSDAERAARDKAAIERARVRCRKRRSFGVKHCLIMRKGTKIHDDRLINFKTNTGRWVHLPNYVLIEEATQIRVPIPPPETFVMRTRPPPITPIDDELIETHFRFVMRLDDTPQTAVIPPPLLVAHPSTHVIASPMITPERVTSAKENAEKFNRLELKQDRTKTAKSAVKQRIIGSAMPRDISHGTSAKEEKQAVPVDLSLVYPSFNRAKSQSESRTKPITFFRWALLPHNEMTLRLLFQSDEEGKYHQNYTFQVVDYPEADFKVSVKGICQYTNLFANLARIFPPSIWVEQIVEDRLAPVYVEGDKKLYFGPLLAGKKKVDILADKCPQNVYSFTLKNHHKRNLNVHFNIAKHQGINPKDKSISPTDFSIVPDRCFLHSKAEQTFKFYAHPNASGRCEDTILAFTEYNPIPTTIVLSALSVKPQAEVLTKNVFIEKVPIREISAGNIEVRNKSALLPIRWRLLGIDQLPPEFIFESREGTLKASSEIQLIPVKFTSTTEKPVVHLKKPLRIEFSSEDPDMPPIQTENFTISGESYDLVLDITFPKVLDSALDFGISKVNDEVMRQMTIRNKSRSDCGFQLVAVYDNLSTNGQYQAEKIKSLLDFQPSSGTLTSADRPITVNVVCKPSFEIELKQEKIVRCLVLDPARANMRVAEIPIKTNIAAKYSKFVLTPPVGEVRFPSTLPVQKRTRIVTLQNVGDYEIVFVIKKISSNSHPADIPQKPNVPPASKKGNQDGGKDYSPVGNASISNTHTSRKTDNSSVNAGLQGVPFVIRPLTGVVKVGDVVQITVEFGSDVIGTHEETHSVEITDRDPTKYPNGIIYTFSGEIAVPTIDVRNIDGIFAEHMIIPPEIAVTDVALESWLLDRSAYVPKRRQFYVQHTFVGMKRKIRLKLTNPTNIQCPVAISIKPPVALTGKAVAKSTTEGFAIIESSAVVIEPHQFAHVVILFSPTLAIKYQANFEIMIETQPISPSRGSSFNFEILAEAILPNLRILPPVLKDRKGQLCLYYQKTAVGKQQTLPVRIFNDTVMPLAVTFRIRNADHVFELIPDSGDGPLAQREATFGPREERTINIKFAPTLAGRFRKYLEVSCVENISPDIFIQLRAEAVLEEVELEGLPPLTYEDRLRLTPATGNQVEDVVMERYHLYFGDCKPSQSLTAKFEIVNPTANWLRFEWVKLPAEILEITPRAGHVKPQSFAEIQARYNILEETHINILPVLCSLAAITVPETYDLDNVWNSDKQSLQVLSEIRKARTESDSQSTPHSAEKLDTDRDSDHSVKDGSKHDKKDAKKAAVELKKSKEKKPLVKKESLMDKHRKNTDKVDKTKRRPSEPKKEGNDVHNKKSGQPTSLHTDPLPSRVGDPAKTAGSPRGTLISLGGTKTEVTRTDDSSLQPRILAPTPEPLTTVKVGSNRNVTLVVSSIVGFAKYECTQQEILFKDTHVLETRKATFTVKNTGKVALRYKTMFSVNPEACLAYLQQVDAMTASRVVSSQEKEGRPEKGKKGKVEQPVADEDGQPVPLTPSTKSEKAQKHNSPRAPAAPSATDAPLTKESTKRRRKVSKDSSGEQQQQIQLQQQATPSPRSGGGGQAKGAPSSPIIPPNIRKIDVNSFKSLTANQTCNLSTVFIVSPGMGVINPTTSQIFTLEFRPEEALEYMGCLFFQLENQDPRGLPLALPIHGTARLPILHLNTATQTNLRWSEVPNQDSRILDFRCIGTDATLTQQLVLTNPTDADYEFTLNCLDYDGTKKPPFEVSRKAGLVAAGKRSMVDVTFIPYCLGAMESKWALQVPAQGVVVALNFNAVVRDPDVSLTPLVMAFKPLLPKMRKTKNMTLSNNELIDLKFEVDMENFKGYDHMTWEVVPSKGIIKAKTQRELAVSVFATKEFTANLVLMCRVEKCSQPLRMTLEHEILAPVIEIIYLNDNNRTTLLDDSDGHSNTVDFGHTDACSVYKKNFQMTNNGSINISYKAKIISVASKHDEARDRPERTFLQLSSPEGIIMPGKSFMLILTYMPRSLKDKLTHLQVVIEIEFGPRYILALTGDLLNIDIDFSFDECDFGPVLIVRDSPEVGTTVPLIIANHTRRQISLDLVNYVLPPSMAFEFAPLSLEPGNSTIHTVMFLPTDVGHCTGVLTFLMNQSITKSVVLKGEGVEMHVAVPARMRHLLFNTSEIGIKSTVEVEVLNQSQVEVTGRVVLENKSKSTQLKSLMDEKILHVYPEVDNIIPAQKSLKATINFLPLTRTLNFDARVSFVTDQQVVRELSTLTGNCDGLDVILQERVIDFGALVLNGSLRRNIVMKSLSELGAYFSWDCAKIAPHFIIKPRKGYVPAKGEVVFEITFCPKSLSSDIRIHTECDLPGNRKPIQLSLVGSCIPLPTSKDTIVFECPVRQTDAKPLTLTNTTATVWQVKPFVNNDRWTVPASITVKPNVTETFEAVFKPLDGGPHQAVVSVMLPTGQAAVFNLFGKTQPPKPNGKIARDVPCRTEQREFMTLHNWLPKMQAFRVIYEYVKPDKPDASIELTGKGVVHIPALAQLEYEFIFKALRDKDINAVYIYRIVFKCEETGEYQYYDLQYKVVKGPSFDSKTIISHVRTLRRESVKIMNPLDTPVSLAFMLQGNTSEVTLEPTTHIAVGGKREVEIFLDYFPLKPGLAQGRIDVASPELGAFFIELTLQATAGTHETPIHFECVLGATTTQSCKILNYGRTKADFLVKVTEGASEFQLVSDRSTYSVQPGTITYPSEQAIEVLFDPCQLGEFHGKVLAASPAAGEFHFVFIGNCIRPKPKGPYVIAPTGESVPLLEFKNPFLRPSAFNLVSSNRVFVVKDVTDMVKAKKTLSLPVTFSPNNTDSGLLRRGSLLGQITITPKFEGDVVDEENAEWVYYLKADCS